MMHSWHYKLIIVIAIVFYLSMVGMVALEIPTIGYSTKVTATVETDLYGGVLIVQTDSGQGSCFVVAQKDGWFYAITARHVAEGTIWVTVDSEVYDAEVVRVDSQVDAAMIRFKSPEKYKIYEFGTAEVGKACTTVGWNGDSRLLYKGYVVSVDFRGFVAANGGVLPGCSGGVLLDEKGLAIGITVASPVYGMSVFDSTALYVPIRFAKAMIVAVLGE